MKKKLVLLLSSVVIAVSFAGCASDNNSASEKPKQEAQKDPEIGMTKDQVVALYGTTDNKQVSSDGEVWIYNLNMGEAFIPFNFGYRPKTRIITFDKDGKVSHWSYSK